MRKKGKDQKAFERASCFLYSSLSLSSLLSHSGSLLFAFTAPH